nr:MAG TPA: hypothetical protein [Caudoviricetes sp.]
MFSDKRLLTKAIIESCTSGERRENIAAASMIVLRLSASVFSLR